MTIGQLLKSMRLHAGLTQHEMAAGLMSESFYSKVERDVHSIDADLLLQLLAKHHFNFIKFASTMLNQKSADPYFETSVQITFAQNAKDKEKLDEIVATLPPEKDLPSWLRFQIEQAYAWTTYSNDRIPPEFKQRMQQLILTDNWDASSFKFLSLALIFLDTDDAYELVNQAYEAYKKKPSLDYITMAMVATVAVDFLNVCYHRKEDKKYTKTSINFLLYLPPDPSLGFKKMLGTYYQALFDHDHKTVDMFRTILKGTNLYPLIKDTIE